ncbi:ABC transporter ATP-binding protein [Rhodococcus sp. C26F]
MTTFVKSDRAADEVVLDVKDLEVAFPDGRGGSTTVVAGVSFRVHRGETLGIVGESGCGKSTTAKAVLQLAPSTAGTVQFAGQDLSSMSPRELRRVRRKLQVVLQDPISALNPRRKVRDIIGEGLSIWRVPDAAARVRRAMESVGLDVEIVGERLPGEFSGGQCQRISIARALAMEPEVLICDEPVSALDVSVQAQIVNLLEDLKEQYHLTMLFVSHDLSVVRVISDRVMVMYLGKVCEIGPTMDLFDTPLHPYTRTLLDAVPVPDPHVDQRKPLPVGEVPSILAPPSGCRFRTRCSRAREICAAAEPPMIEVATSRSVACHFPLT